MYTRSSKRTEAGVKAGGPPPWAATGPAARTNTDSSASSNKKRNKRGFIVVVSLAPAVRHCVYQIISLGRFVASQYSFEAILISLFTPR